MRRSILSVLLLALTAVPGSASAVPTLPSPGSVPDVEGVDLRRGLPTPRQELPVLPGKGGLTPDLALSYSVGRRDGTFGPGWGQPALESAVSRTGPTGGTPRFPDAAADHRFFLDGAELVDPDGNGTYNPVDDPFTLVRRVRQGDATLRWEVTSRGRLRVYGRLADVPTCGPEVDTLGSCGREVRWRLTRASDDLGNTWTLHWERPQGAAALHGAHPAAARPDSLSYSDGRARIEWHYEPRPDVRLTAEGGVLRLTPERLARLDVVAVGQSSEQVAMRYTFEYQQHRDSVLAAVWRDDPNGADALVLQRYEYADAGVAMAAGEDLATVAADGVTPLAPSPFERADFTSASGSTTYTSRVELVDVNRDSRPDLIVLGEQCTQGGGPSPAGVDTTGDVCGPAPGWTSCGVDHRVFLNTGEQPPRFRLEPTLSSTLDSLLGHSGTYADTPGLASRFVDLDGDGWVEIVRGGYGPRGSTVAPGLPGGGWASGTADLTADLIDAPWSEELAELRLADLDADGLLDRVEAERFCRGTGDPASGYFETGACLPLAEGVSAPSSAPAGCMADGSAARFPEAAIGTTEGAGQTSYSGQHDASKKLDATKWIWRHTTFADFNGDGVTDRQVALAWPEEDLIVTHHDIAGTAHGIPIWADADGRCGGLDAIYLGDGAGGFHAAPYGVGGAFDSGGPTGQPSALVTVDVDASRTSTHAVAVSHLAVNDLDGDGRPELVQRCDGDLRALPHLGMSAELDVAGFGLGANADGCPASADPAQLPDASYSATLSGASVRYVDLDGDGLTDIWRDPGVQRGPVGLQPRWHRNGRGTAALRLIAIVTPRGGRTELEWATAAQYTSAGVVANVPVLAAREGATGRTEFAFGGGWLLGRRFAGFATATARGSAGTELRFRFGADPLTAGTTLSAATHWEDGSLHALEVRVPALGFPQAPLLYARPYWNPTVRTCRFDFARAHAGGDVEDFLDNCAAGPAALNATANPAWALDVEELEHDWAAGVVTETRELGDLATTDDDLTTRFLYHPAPGAGGAFDEVLAGARLAETWTEDTSGARRGHFTYPLAGYNGLRWERELQHDDILARERTRSYADGLLVRETGWAEPGSEGAITATTHDHCWQPHTVHTALGVATTTRDARCRVVSHAAASGSLETREYDALGRLVRRSMGGGHGAPVQVSQTYYDHGAELDRPVSVDVTLEPDQTVTLVKRYADAHGRPWKRTRCRRALGAVPISWSHHLDEAFACAADDREADDYATHHVWLYDAASGQVAWQSEAFDARDGGVSLASSPAFPGTSPAVALDGEVPAQRRWYDSLGRATRIHGPERLVTVFGHDLDTEWSTSAGVTRRFTTVGLERTERRNGAARETQIQNAFGELVATTAAANTRTDYSYDGFGRHVLTEQPYVPVRDACDAPTRWVRPTAETSYWPNDLVKEVIDARGGVTRSSYDASGRLTAVEAADGSVVETRTYDDVSGQQRVRVTDEHGHTTTDWLDGLGRVVRRGTDDGETAFTYDCRGRVASLTRPWGEEILRSYGRGGQLRQVRRVRGADEDVTALRHNARGQVIRRVDGDGEVRSFDFDALGQPLGSALGDPSDMTARQLTSFTYDAAGRPEVVTQSGVATRYVYDAAGRVRFEERGYDASAAAPWLQRDSSTYDVADRVAEIADATGRAVRSFRDRLGRERYRFFKHQGAVVAFEQSDYDRDGNAVRAVDADGLVTCRDFDARGRLIGLQTPGAGPSRVEYVSRPDHPVTGGTTSWMLRRSISATGDVSEAYTDGMGREVFQVGADGVMVEQVYEAGLLRRVNRRSAAGDVLEVKLRTYHPASDRVQREWDWSTPAGAAACLTAPSTCPRVTGYVDAEWTAAGRLDRLTTSAGDVHDLEYTTAGDMLVRRVAFGDATEVRLAYDAFGKVQRRELGPVGDAIVVTLERDRELLLQRETWSRKATGEQQIHSYQYDAAGRRTRATLARDGVIESELRWGYDPRGRVSSKAYRMGGVPLFQPGTTRSLGWGRSPAGRLDSVTYPTGQTASYLRDASGRLERVVLGTKATDPLIAKMGAFDAAGRAGSTTFGDGTEVARTWLDGRSASRTLAISGLPLYEESYTYDVAGRLEQVARTVSSGAVEQRKYSYDHRGFLRTEWTRDAAGQRRFDSYVYDGHGRRRLHRVWDNGRVSQSTTFGYHDGTRLASVGPAQLPLSAWDAYGRQLADQRGHGMLWGLAGELRELRLAGKTIESMTFDTSGQRVSRSLGAATSFYLSSDVPGEVLFQTSGKGDQREAQLVVRTPEGGVLALVTPAGEILPFASGRADARQDVDPAVGGQVRHHGAFGASLGASDAVTELGFHGTWATSTPLRVAGVRVYDPETGRFLSPDPLGLVAANDPNDAVDLYRYAHNDPVHLSDATGYAAACGAMVQRPEPMHMVEQSLLASWQRHQAQSSQLEAAVRAASADRSAGGAEAGAPSIDRCSGAICEDPWLAPDGSVTGAAWLLPRTGTSSRPEATQRLQHAKRGEARRLARSHRLSQRGARKAARGIRSSARQGERTARKQARSDAAWYREVLGQQGWRERRAIARRALKEAQVGARPSRVRALALDIVRAEEVAEVLRGHLARTAAQAPTEEPLLSRSSAPIATLAANGATEPELPAVGTDATIEPGGWGFTLEPIEVGPGADRQAGTAQIMKGGARLTHRYLEAEGTVTVGGAEVTWTSASVDGARLDAHIRLGSEAVNVRGHVRGGLLSASAAVGGGLTQVGAEGSASVLNGEAGAGATLSLPFGTLLSFDGMVSGSLVTVEGGGEVQLTAVGDTLTFSGGAKLGWIAGAGGAISVVIQAPWVAALTDTLYGRDP